MDETTIESWEEAEQLPVEKLSLGPAATLSATPDSSRSEPAEAPNRCAAPLGSPRTLAFLLLMLPWTY